MFDDPDAHVVRHYYRKPISSGLDVAQGIALCVAVALVLLFIFGLWWIAGNHGHKVKSKSAPALLSQVLIQPIGNKRPQRERVGAVFFWVRS